MQWVCVQPFGHVKDHISPSNFQCEDLEQLDQIQHTQFVSLFPKRPRYHVLFLVDNNLQQNHDVLEELVGFLNWKAFLKRETIHGPLTEEVN